jgi:hypothetical protein
MKPAQPSGTQPSPREEDPQPNVGFITIGDNNFSLEMSHGAAPFHYSAPSLPFLFDLSYISKQISYIKLAPQFNLQPLD